MADADNLHKFTQRNVMTGYCFTDMIGDDYHD